MSVKIAILLIFACFAAPTIGSTNICKISIGATADNVNAVASLLQAFKAEILSGDLWISPDDICRVSSAIPLLARLNATQMFDFSGCKREGFIETAFLLVVPPSKPNSCLLPPELQPPPRCVAFTDAPSIENLVSFVNEHCAFHRTLDGELTVGGQRLQRLHARLYRPGSESISHQHTQTHAATTQNEGQQSWQSANTCEVLTEAPTREVFLRCVVIRRLTSFTCALLLQ